MVPRQWQRGEDDCALGLAWLGLSGSTVLLERLTQVGPQGVWGASKGTLLGWGISERTVRIILEARGRFDAGEARGVLEATGQRFIPFGSPLYPSEFTQLESPPAGLFVRGSGEVLHRVARVPRITVVGTRKATAQGLAAASAFVTALSRRGVVVVSGMALGIDARAHSTALDYGGSTVAILGCGADVVYPPRHRWLYERIVQAGVVSSELPPGSNPTKWTFPHRNRLLAALGDAVLVVEGSNKSGALQTAKWALELGRPVFCVPGSIFEEASEGCNSLICDGAFSALRPEAMVEDFLEVTRMQRGERGSSQIGRLAGGEQLELAGVAAVDGPGSRVLKALGRGPKSVDRLVALSGLSVREVSAALGEMEIRGAVSRAGPGMFLRVP